MMNVDVRNTFCLECETENGDIQSAVKI